MEDIIDLQNYECTYLAEKNIECAVLFQETHNLQAIADQLSCLESILLTQGIFIHEFLDTMNDSRV